MATGDSLRFEANRTHSGKYLCSAENGLEKAITASAYLDVRCKYSIIILEVMLLLQDFLIVRWIGVSSL